MEGEEEEAVDLTSPDFDPAKALLSRAVNIPVPNVRPFENLAQYESAMKGLRAPKKAASSAQTSDTPGSSKDLSTQARNLPPLVATHRKPAKTLLTRMKETKQGPLEVLHSCMTEKRRVIVTTRTFKGLRGICTGYLVAFDKFWNLAMADVEEVYQKPPLGKKFFNQETLTVSKLLQSEKTAEIVAKKDFSAQSTQRKETFGERRVDSSAVRAGQGTAHSSTVSKGQGAGIDLRGETHRKQGGSDHEKAGLSSRKKSHHKTDQRQSRGQKKMDTGEQRTDKSTSSRDTSLKRHEKARQKGSMEVTEDLCTLQSKLTNLQRELAALGAEESDDGLSTSQSSVETSEVNPSHTKGGKARKPRGKKEETQFFKRHVNQLFVRGENVVLVSIKDA